jgi:signal peptidase II
MKQQKTLKLPIFCLIYLGVVIFCIVADQLTKIWIYDNLLNGGKGPSVQIIGKFLQFTPVLNRGAAFGIGNSRASDIIFFVVTVVGIPVFCYLLLRSRTRSLLSQISFAMIIGGTIGNAIDRATYATEGTFFSGGVRDFISFSIFPPVFNVAVMCLTFGVFMAIAAIIWFDPDSLVKILMEERAQAAAKQANVTDGAAVQTCDTTPSTDIAVETDTQIAVEQDTTLQTESPDENDTTN